MRKVSGKFIVRTGAALVAMFVSSFAAQASDAVYRDKDMVSAAHPLATQTGVEILAKGGSAVDAAIAIQTVLTLVEPQSSGIGGGAFTLIYDPASKSIKAYDGREKAPASATPDMFLREDGRPLPYREAILGGRSVGVPGVIAQLWKMHQAHGKLPWKDLFDPAIAMAEQGFEVTPRLNMMITVDPAIPQLPDLSRYFLGSDGKPLPVGHRLKNPELAVSLRLIAEKGPDGFYKGPLAEQIVASVTTSPGTPGGMTLDDLAAYEAKDREVLCMPYRAYRVCGMPPPTSGGLAVLQILGMLENFDLGALQPGSVEAVHLISEASRLAYADRAEYVADSDFIDVPIAGMLDKAYLKERAGLIRTDKTMGFASEGTPPMKKSWLYEQDVERTRPGTTHFSIVDSDGLALSMTSSVEGPFGAHIMAGGFILNNQLTDFSFRYERDGKPVANAPAPFKRPRSSMSPTIVLDGQNDFYLAIGSPGGSRIPLYTLQTVIGVLDWNMDVQSAISAPHHLNRNGAVEVEVDTPLVGLKSRLEALGHDVQFGRTVSGLHGIRRIDGRLEGGADPRREGIVDGH